MCGIARFCVHGVPAPPPSTVLVRSGWHADSGRVNRRYLVFKGQTLVNPNKIAFLQKIDLAPYGTRLDSFCPIRIMVKYRDRHTVRDPLENTTLFGRETP